MKVTSYYLAKNSLQNTCFSAPTIKANHFYNSKFNFVIYLLFICGYTAAQQPNINLPITVAHDNLVEQLMEIDRTNFESILSNKKEYEIQIIYTQINRDSTGKTTFVQHQLGNDANHYFYPASLVKLPVCALALQKCAALNIPSSAIMITDSSNQCQYKVSVDSSAQNFKPSIMQYVKKMMLVSSNFSYSRVFEFLGTDEIKATLENLGYPKTLIKHRFDAGCNAITNRYTNAIYFLNTMGDTLYQQLPKFSENTLIPTVKSLQKGRGYMNAKGKLVHHPKDFTTSNFMPLQEINDFLIGLLYPECLPENKRLKINQNDYDTLLKAMSSYPRESFYPKYDALKYEDSYKKYLMYATYHDSIKTDTMRIFNVVGQSYGWLGDVAYFIDYKNKVDFFLSAVIYVNKNKILNDGKYEYKEVGFPFLANLGQLIYSYDKTRKRPFYSDFSKFEKYRK
jgi:hypothetical protein